MHNAIRASLCLKRYLLRRSLITSGCFANLSNNTNSTSNASKIVISHTAGSLRTANRYQISLTYLHEGMFLFVNAPRIWDR